MKNLFTLVLFVGVLLNNQVKADLPVHCLTSQVQGKWKFSLTDEKDLESEYQNNCGHHIPDAEATSLKSLSDDSIRFVKTNEVNLMDEGRARPVDMRFKGSKSQGMWTMVYDEGFEVRQGDYRYFSFSMYFPNKEKKGKFLSNCAKTLTGWFKNEKSGKVGCFKGEKIGVTEIINDPTSKLIVTQNRVENVDDESQDAESSKTVFKSSRKRTKMLEFRFMSKFFETLHMQEAFTDHQKVVNRLNFVNKSWKANLIPEFASLSIQQLNKLAGRKSKGFPKPNEGRFMEKKARFTSKDLSHLPKEFSWEKEMPKAMSQGDCGSCYAISSIQMIEARVKIKTKKDVKLSVQHVMDCSFYNQGCDGGYPYLVGKFGHDFNYVDEKCKPYTEKDGKCSTTCDFSDRTFMVKAKDYKYVGDRYAQSNEKNIMEEVQKNGPVVVDFEPDYLFMMYQDGIYKAISEKEWLKKGEKKPECLKVDHSVVLYGWGEENGEKYWKLQNSWGENWGQNGRFKVKRGTDEMGIESSAEAIDPIVIEKKEEVKDAVKKTMMVRDIEQKFMMEK